MGELRVMGGDSGEFRVMGGDCGVVESHGWS